MDELASDKDATVTLSLNVAEVSDSTLIRVVVGKREAVLTKVFNGCFHIRS